MKSWWPIRRAVHIPNGGSQIFKRKGSGRKEKSMLSNVHASGDSNVGTRWLPPCEHPPPMHNTLFVLSKMIASLVTPAPSLSGTRDCAVHDGPSFQCSVVIQTQTRYRLPSMRPVFRLEARTEHIQNRTKEICCAKIDVYDSESMLSNPLSPVASWSLEV